MIEAYAKRMSTGEPVSAVASMLLRRLKVYSFRVRMPQPPAGLNYCAPCLAQLVLRRGVAVANEASSVQELFYL